LFKSKSFLSVNFEENIYKIYLERERERGRKERPRRRRRRKRHVIRMNTAKKKETLPVKDVFVTE